MSDERAKIRPFAALLLAGTVTSAATTLAAKPKLQVVGTGEIGWTDNIYSSPDDPVPGVPEKQAGTFGVIAPSLVLASGSPAAYHRLSFTHATSVFFAEPEANTASNRIDYRAFFDLSRRTELVLTSSLVQSGIHTSGMIITPGENDVAALTPGTGTGSYMIGSFETLLGYDLGPGWRTYQGAGAVGATPILEAEGPKTAEVHARVGLERYWEADSVGPEVFAGYTVIDDAVDEDGNPIGRQRQLLATGIGRWRHDWGRYFTSTAEAGVMRVYRINTGRGFWGPVGLAALAYATDTGEAELSYAHRVTTNALLGQILLVDEVRLRGAVPVAARDEVVVAASGGYQRGRLIEEDATLAANVDVILIDVGVGWQVSDNWMLGPRYQYLRQMSDADLPPLPLSFQKHTVMLGATFKLPPDRDMPRPYRSPRRVDRADEIRDVGRPLEDRTRGGPGER